MSVQPVLINGKLTDSPAKKQFQSTNPNTKQLIDDQFPISEWDEIDACLESAANAAVAVRSASRETIASFLEAYADAIDANADALVAAAHLETGLPVSPRLKDVELPRTSNQLRQAANAARTASWTQPIIDTKLGIRACYQSLGPVCVFGPNNFPFAFNSIAGGDFAAALAAGNPVIAKANSSHPLTSFKFAEIVAKILPASGLPAGMVQMIYRTSHADGERLVSDPRLAATGYTGSRHAGLKLKAASDAAGKPFYAELSAINPVVILPGCLKERCDALIDEYATSGLMGAGQFCTNPGLLVMMSDATGDAFVAGISAKYKAAKPGTLLSPAVGESLTKGVSSVQNAGAKLLVGGSAVSESRVAFENTILEVPAKQFVADSHAFQTEMFGNAVLVVRCESVDEMVSVVKELEGNLTGSIYSAKDGSDDAAYDQIAPHLISRVGRMLNDKMPTGVAVSPAMNHGGPFPATAHPNFTAVGIPASIVRFTKLTSFDAVRPNRLPDLLQDASPISSLWRCVDGQWKTGHLS